MISVEDALQIVKTVSQQLSPVIVPIHEALGKVLAQDIHAPDPLPPFPASVKVVFFFSIINSDLLHSYQISSFFREILFDVFLFCD